MICVDHHFSKGLNVCFLRYLRLSLAGERPWAWLDTALNALPSQTVLEADFTGESI